MPPWLAHVLVWTGPLTVRSSMIRIRILSGRTAALLACRIYYGHLTFTAITQSCDIWKLDSLPNGDIFGWRMILFRLRVAMLMRLFDQGGVFVLETDDSQIGGVVRRGNQISLKEQAWTVIYTGCVEFDMNQDVKFRSALVQVPQPKELQKTR